MQPCRYHGTGFHPCSALAAPASTGYWASRGYCPTHAEQLEKRACGCEADRFFTRDLSARTRASYPTTCGYCRARAADAAAPG